MLEQPLRTLPKPSYAYVTLVMQTMFMIIQFTSVHLYESTNDLQASFNNASNFTRPLPYRGSRRLNTAQVT